MRRLLARLARTPRDAYLHGAALTNIIFATCPDKHQRQDRQK